MTVLSAFGLLKLETDLHDTSWNVVFETLCGIGNQGQRDTKASPQIVVKYGLWMALVVYEIKTFRARCWCPDCRYLSRVIQPKFDPKALASILQDVVSITEDKNLDPVLFGDWLTQVLSCVRIIQDLLCFLADDADDQYPMELKEFDWMGEVARAQIRRLTKWLDPLGEIQRSGEENEARKQIMGSLFTGLEPLINDIVSRYWSSSHVCIRHKIMNLHY